MSFWDIFTGGSSSPSGNDLTEMVAQYPALKERMEGATATLAKNEKLVWDVAEGGKKAPLPNQVLDALKQERAAVVTLRTRFFELKDLITAGVNKAKSAGKLTDTQVQQLKDVGLAGFSGGAYQAALRGLGGEPTSWGTTAASIQYGSSAAAMSAGGGDSKGAGEVSGLGILPLIPLAVAALIVAGAGVSLYAVHRATMESAAEAEAIQARNAVVNAAWVRQVEQQKQGLNPAPLPPLPAATPAQSAASSFGSSAGTGVGLGVIVLAGIAGWYFLRKRKGKG